MRTVVLAATQLFAYSSDESGREEIYVQSFPTLDARVQISTDGGTQPVWAHDGRELFYRSARDLMGSPMTSEAPMAFASPRPLFADRFERPQPDGHTSYDVAKDGRFIMIAAPMHAESSHSGRNELHLVLNWFQELRAHAASK